MGDWKQIPGWFEYEVADGGAVRRLGRSTPLKTRRDKDGYVIVALSSSGRPKTMKAHQIVALAFIGPKRAGQQVRHLDGNPANNVAANLSYGTPAQNCADREAHGNTVRGDSHGSAKTTDAQVISALRRARVIGQVAAAREIGIGQAALSMVKTGRTRRHLAPLIEQDGTV